MPPFDYQYTSSRPPLPGTGDGVSFRPPPMPPIIDNGDGTASHGWPQPARVWPRRYPLAPRPWIPQDIPPSWLSRYPLSGRMSPSGMYRGGGMPPSPNVYHPPAPPSYGYPGNNGGMSL